MEQIARTRDVKATVSQRKKLRRRVVIELRALSGFTAVTTHYEDAGDTIMARRWGGKRRPITGSSLRRIDALAWRRGGLRGMWVLPSSMAVGFTYDDGEVQADD